MPLTVEHGTYLGPARVTQVEERRVELAFPDQQVWAQLALAYPYQPVVGDSVLAQVIANQVHTISRWDLVLDAFGARRRGPGLSGREQPWLAGALLDAQPSGGWGKATTLSRIVKTKSGTPSASPPSAAAMMSALQIDPATLREGSKLYRVHCLHCHGLTGDGRGPTSKWVNPHPRDYRRGLFKFQSVDQTDGRKRAPNRGRSDL